MGLFSSIGKILDPVAKVTSFIPGPHQPFAAGYSSLRSITGGDDSAGGGSGGGTFGGLTELAAKYGGPVAGVLSLIQGGRLNREALGAQRQAMEFAQQRQRETAPLRSLAIRDLSGATPEAPDLSGSFVDPTNPFSTPSQRLSLSLPAIAPVQGSGGKGTSPEEIARRAQRLLRGDGD